ncbi:MAG: TonB-dependent receptor [Acidobacteriia bacterium]|nr:TonB-dependent receptor [Terriglobia bacterium]
MRDSSGLAVAAATVQLLNQGTGAKLSVTTDNNGDFRFSAVDIGSYVLEIAAPGFQKAQFAQFDVLARESRRLDAVLKLASQAQSITVETSVGPPIQTDTSNIAETKTGRELVDLPVAIATRGAGSTSPISTLTTQPGVQTDQSGNISVAGGNPSQLSVTIDGISVMGARAAQAGPIAELFPSFNAIEEIRVSEVINPAEFGGVSDIATISKSGTNIYHGGVFENFQNSEMNAANTFTHTAPTIKMNNFGAYLGGPLSIPKVYDAKNKTFFFASFEALRRPNQTIQIESVPSLAMRSGNLTALGGPVLAPSEISTLSEKMLQYLYPLPNFGAPGATSNNYVAYFATPINSNQSDGRFDQQISSRQQVNFRVTYKNRRVEVPPSGSALLGSFSQPEVDFAVAGGYTFIMSPRVINELKGGISGNRYSNSYGVTAAQIASELGLGAGFSIPPGDAVPEINISGYGSTSAFRSYSYDGANTTYQLLDTLTWTRGQHTLKFGGDYRYQNALYQNSYSQSRLGIYNFTGSVMSALLSNGVTTKYEPFESFLLGYPDTTQIATIIQPNNQIYAPSYATFAQDDWKVSSRLTINYGLRWEYHPMFKDHLNNITSFDPHYVSIVNGQKVAGAVLIPNQAAFSIVNPQFAESVAPTPIITAAQDGLPESMRYSQKTDFSPRIGFAWKPFASNKTVVRGGYGRFIEALTAALANDGGTVASSDVGLFTNTIANGTPQYTFPYPFPSNIAQPGTQNFTLAFPSHWSDPTVHEWDVTLEQDLGKGVGIRVSYDGSHSSDLGLSVNLNELPANVAGYGASVAQSPFPLWNQIAWREDDGIQNYEAGTVSVHKRFAAGLQFEGSYTFAKNLADSTGYNSTGGSSEMGGHSSDQLHPLIDYGNVGFTARQRFLGTFLYELPFGKGRAFVNTSPVLDRVIGGWELAGVITIQTGQFMSILSPGDPSGTGFNVLQGDGRADTVPGVSPYSGQSLNQWINPKAFAVPANNIGRFGDSQLGSVVGPGEQVVSLSILKRIALGEHVRMEISAAAANLFNHPNYAVPSVLDLASVGNGFARITGLQTAEGAGPRSIQLSGRVNF